MNCLNKLIVSLAMMSIAVIQPAISNENVLIERISSEEIKFVGNITPSSVQDFFKLVENNTILPTNLIISSGGGDAESAMKLAGWIKKNSISITIENACLSSCANYLVPAASKVLVRKDALIGWHGGALQTTWDVDSDMLKSKEQQDKFITGLKKWCQNESVFFDKLDAKQEILIIGHLDHHAANRKHFAWTYTLSDLERMGWSNIVLESDEELPSWNEKIGLRLDVISLTEADYDLNLDCELTLQNINFTPYLE